MIGLISNRPKTAFCIGKLFYSASEVIKKYYYKQNNHYYDQKYYYSIGLHMEVYRVKKLQNSKEKVIHSKAGVLVLLSGGNRFCMLLIVVPLSW